MSKKNKKKEEMEACECEEQECECGSMECDCGHHHHHSCECSCHDDEGFERQFFTKEEKIQMLEEYLADLKAEQKGVEEAIEELRKPASTK